MLQSAFFSLHHLQKERGHRPTNTSGNSGPSQTNEKGPVAEFICQNITTLSISFLLILVTPPRNRFPLNKEACYLSSQLSSIAHLIMFAWP